MNPEQRINLFLSLGTISSANLVVAEVIKSLRKQGFSQAEIANALSILDRQ